MTNNAYAILKGKYLQILPSKNMQEAISFVLKFLSLLLLWKVVFFVTWRNEGLLNAYNQFSLEVINVILICCSALLEFMGYTTEVISAERLVRIKGTLGVSVGEPCIGYEVTAIFMGLIVASKGRWTKKAWFLPFGVLVIYVLNLFRISALAMLVTINPVIWEINHKFVFSIIVYLAIFLLWRFWLRLNLISSAKQQVS